jgi:APA family basic amino acid/polyamine antiporter
MPFIPVATIILCVGLMLALDLASWLRLVGWLVLGLIVRWAMRRIRLPVPQN